MAAADLDDTVPDFDRSEEDTGPADLNTGMSAVAHIGSGTTKRDALAILITAVVILAGAELVIRVFDIPDYILPTPSQIATTLVTDWGLLWPHLLITWEELGLGFVIGASIGVFLAATITQIPLVEKIIAPYILILVTTPMMALVPLLMLRLGFGMAPKVIAVSLAVGPMVMINAATGFRRVDLAKIALAKSFGATTLDIYIKIRIPMALPMVLVGMMVGSIFGVITAVGAEMVGGADGLGGRLTYFASLLQVPDFFAAIVLLAGTGVALYLFWSWVANRWASWSP